jgi:hypothetical protein
MFKSWWTWRILLGAGCWCGTMGLLGMAAGKVVGGEFMPAFGALIGAVAGGSMADIIYGHVLKELAESHLRTELANTIPPME